MNRRTDSFARPIVALLLAASTPGMAAHAANRSASDEVSDVDQPDLARQAVARGDSAEALSRYVRVLASRPRDLTALVGAGNAAVELGDFSAGLAFFGRAEEVDPRNGRVKAGLASALAQTEQPGAALKLFDEAVSLGVPEVEVAGDRGLAWDLRGNPRRAQRDYALALANKPDDHEVTMRLALSQAITGDRDGALRTLEPWLRKQDQGAWRTRAFVLAITGDTKGAAQAASAVLPQAQADAMSPFFAKLASLNSAEKAMAANFGYLPGGQPKAVQQALSTSSAMASADARGGGKAQGGLALASRESTSRSAAPVLSELRAKAPEPKPAVAAAPPVPKPPAVAAPSPAFVARSAVKPSPVVPPAPRPTEIAKPAVAPVKPVVIAAATPVKPAAPGRPFESNPEVAAIIAGRPEPAAARPAGIAAVANRPVGTAPVASAVRPAAAVVVDAQPARSTQIVTLTEADLAELRAQTAADAEAEAQSDRELAAPAAKLEVPAKPPQTRPAGLRPKLAEAPVKLPARPVEAPVKATDAGTKPANARIKLAETPAEPSVKAVETRTKVVEAPATIAAGPAKPVEDRMKTAEARPVEASRAPPLTTSRIAKAHQVAMVSMPRPVRPLPLPKDIAHAFRALPQGSALSADIALAKSTAAPKASAKKIELADNDAEPTPAKSRKAAADKMKPEAAGKGDSKSVRDAKAAQAAQGARDAKATKLAQDAKAAREAKAAVAAQALKDAQAAKAAREAKVAQALKDAQAEKQAQAARDAKTARETKAAAAAQALKDGRAAKVAREQAAKEAQARKEAQAAKVAHAAREAREAKAREAQADKEALAAKDAQAARDRAARIAEVASAPKPKAAGERYWVQVAGGSNRADLDKAWTRLKSGPAGTVLKGRAASTTLLKATNRLLVGPFADKDEAQGFINRLAAQGTSSFHFVSTTGQKVDKLQGP